MDFRILEYQYIEMTAVSDDKLSGMSSDKVRLLYLSNHNNYIDNTL